MKLKSDEMFQLVEHGYNVYYLCTQYMKSKIRMSKNSFDCVLILWKQHTKIFPTLAVPKKNLSQRMPTTSGIEGKDPSRCFLRFLAVDKSLEFESQRFDKRWILGF